MAKSLVRFLLDRTGSMNSIKNDTIGNFNQYVKALGDNSDGLDVDINFTLVQFDHQAYEVLVEEKNVSEVPELNDKTFVPRGSTNLIDSVYRLIRDTEKSELLVGNPDMKVVISVLTDGEENASHLYTKEQLAKLVEEKQALGWAFNFMGASFNAYNDSFSKMVGASNTVTYNAYDVQASAAAYGATASNTRRFTKGLVSDTSYSADQRKRSGDINININKS